MRIRGLDLVDLTVSPHHIREKNRDKGLVKLMRGASGVAIALDDNCAIEIVDSKYRVISSKIGAGAKKLYFFKGQPHSERIEITEEYYPISNLIKK